MEAQVQAQSVEFQNIRELQEEEGGGENLFEELDEQWKETQKAFQNRLVGRESGFRYICRFNVFVEP